MIKEQKDDSGTSSPTCTKPNIRRRNIIFLPLRVLYIYRIFIWRNYYAKFDLIFTDDEVRFRERKLMPLRKFLIRVKELRG